MLVAVPLVALMLTALYVVSYTSLRFTGVLAHYWSRVDGRYESHYVGLSWRSWVRSGDRGSGRVVSALPEVYAPLIRAERRFHDWRSRWTEHTSAGPVRPPVERARPRQFREWAEAVFRDVEAPP